MGNEEIKNLIKIMGLQYGKKYSEKTDLKSLRYGKLMVMADQDQDGSHIKGLVINFIHHNWPSLLRHGFIEEFITPIVKVQSEYTSTPPPLLPTRLCLRSPKGRNNGHFSVCQNLSSGKLQQRITIPGKSSTIRVWAPAPLKRPRNISLTCPSTASHLNMVDKKMTRRLKWWVLCYGSVRSSIVSVCHRPSVGNLLLRGKTG